MKSVKYEIWDVAFNQINQQLIYEASIEVKTRMHQQQWNLLWGQIWWPMGRLIWDQLHEISET